MLTVSSIVIAAVLWLDDQQQQPGQAVQRAATMDTDGAETGSQEAGHASLPVEGGSKAVAASIAPHIITTAIAGVDDGEGEEEEGNGAQRRSEVRRGQSKGDGQVADALADWDPFFENEC
jgi:hypothetical protein